jgi:hypothetical protein
VGLRIFESIALAFDLFLGYEVEYPLLKCLGPERFRVEQFGTVEHLHIHSGVF